MILMISDRSYNEQEIRQLIQSQAEQIRKLKKMLLQACSDFNDLSNHGAYDDEPRKAKDLLREALPILHRAFFANYKDTNAANELYDKIKKVVGGNTE